jgi:hypothetical protein
MEENEIIQIIVRQTDLTEDEAKKRLEQHNGHYINVLEDFFGIKKKQSNTLTVNQQIYKEIRTVMDNASFRFYN